MVPYPPPARSTAATLDAPRQCWGGCVPCPLRILGPFAVTSTIYFSPGLFLFYPFLYVSLRQPVPCPFPSPAPSCRPADVTRFRHRFEPVAGPASGAARCVLFGLATALSPFLLSPRPDCVGLCRIIKNHRVPPGVQRSNAVRQITIAEVFS